ncbi:MAG: hypothetical protein ACK5YL_02260 [Holosporales bacterium]
MYIIAYFRKKLIFFLLLVVLAQLGEVTMSIIKFDLANQFSFADIQTLQDSLKEKGIVFNYQTSGAGPGSTGPLIRATVYPIDGAGSSEQEEMAKIEQVLRASGLVKNDSIECFNQWGDIINTGRE